MLKTQLIGETGVGLIAAPRFEDARGEFYPLVVGFPETRLNTSVNPGQYTLRGLHYQAAPHAQTKLIRVIQGAIYDVAVHLPTRKVTQYLLGANLGLWLKIPSNHAHGFLTLQPDTIVEYLTDWAYEPAHEHGLRWNDPDLAIVWPVLAEGGPIINPRDASWPLISEITHVPA